ncbi:hypothetical protein [Streptomyces tendae]|uniref:hypothetical protein n=1 Tax=Streptomyces tendae TaxID=1932 RepID=UPI0036510D4C
MPDPTHPAPVLARISSDASGLHQALCVLPNDRGASASALAARITDAQDLAGTALRLLLTLSPQASRPTPTDLLLLQHVAQIAKAPRTPPPNWPLPWPEPWRTSAARPPLQHDGSS